MPDGKEAVLDSIADWERAQRLKKIGAKLHAAARELTHSRRLNGTAMEFPIVAKKNKEN